MIKTRVFFRLFFSITIVFMVFQAVSGQEASERHGIRVVVENEETYYGDLVFFIESVPDELAWTDESFPPRYELVISPESHSKTCNYSNHPDIIFNWIDVDASLVDLETGEVIETHQFSPGPFPCPQNTSEIRYVDLYTPSGRELRTWLLQLVNEDRIEAETPSHIVFTTFLDSEVLGIAPPRFSSDGQRLIVGDNAERKVLVLDSLTGEELFSIEGFEDSFVLVAFSPDDTMILTITRYRIQLWDSTSEENLLTIGPLEWPFTGASFHSDGEHVLTIDLDGNVVMWHVPDGVEVLRLGEGQIRIPHDAALSPDRHLIAIAEHRSVSTWDAETGELVRQLTTSTGPIFRRIQFSPDGRYILVDGPGTSATMWDVETGEGTLDLRATASCLSPAGHIIAFADWSVEPHVFLWDNENQVELVRWPIPTAVDSISFSPDGHFLVVGLRDTRVQVWDISAFVADS